MPVQASYIDLALVVALALQLSDDILAGLDLLLHVLQMLNFLVESRNVGLEINSTCDVSGGSARR